MTKSECYSQISICNAGIEEDQKKIREWEEKINLYENTNRRLERGQENMADFCSCHSRKIRQTRDYFPQVKYVEGYVQDMTEYLQGAEYIQTMVMCNSAYRANAHPISRHDSFDYGC